ncbi:DUF2892 domain-containing protein [Pseudomonadota bacterium]
MKHNVGGIDRVARLIVGIGIIAWGVYEQNLWGAVGIVPLFTAVIGWCPAYLPIGFSTCDKD